MPFNPAGDTLFRPEERIPMEMLPESLVDRDKAMIALIEKTDRSQPSPLEPAR
jgi:hypothetical protein